MFGNTSYNNDSQPPNAPSRTWGDWFSSITPNFLKTKSAAAPISGGKRKTKRSKKSSRKTSHRRR
jgi:hypothetical protein